MGGVVSVEVCSRAAFICRERNAPPCCLIRDIFYVLGLVVGKGIRSE